MKLLLAEMHHLGDAVLSLPFVQSALAAGHRVHVWCRPSARTVFEQISLPPGSPSSSLCISTWDPPWHEDSPNTSLSKKLRACAKLIALWKQEHFDGATSVWADCRLHGLFAAANIPLRVGLPMNASNYYGGSDVPWRKKRLREGRWLASLLPFLLQKPLLTTSIQRLDPHQHHLETWSQIAAAWSFSLQADPPWFAPAPPPPPGSALANILAKTSGKKILFLHPGGRLACKTWGAENYAAVLAALPQIAPDWAAILCHVPGEASPPPMAENQFVYQPQSFADLLAGIYASDALLGNDSLAAHLAAAYGKPTLAIFGSSDPGIYAPGNHADSVIRIPACPLHPCLDLCRQPSFLCLEAISPTLVISRLRTLCSASAEETLPY